jgi:hypothetical protein
MTTRCPSNDSFEEAESRSFPNAASRDDYVIVSLEFVKGPFVIPGRHESGEPGIHCAASMSGEMDSG